ncbi:hypothetical protein E2562_009606 [Oryza meyeriana var. granulata]|uniref:Uncharacterized protein n=1 Tax=Oryza meyeriana var. granulata TaxID=110450 RepID=A0A6G1BKT1_9ORYZ|nr:hypothetical protein E2562_009606 [Oryza meyeriana var. granulata]
MVIGDFLRRRPVPLQERSRLAWLYTGDRDATRTHVGASHNRGRAELICMLRVVIGFGNIPASKLPREDLALCNDSARMAWQAILPECDAKGILERMSETAPGAMRILGNEVIGLAMAVELLGP